MKYANGLLFSQDMQTVAVINKNRPAYLAGKLSPAGGHVELGESPANAMSREYEEEAGVWIAVEDWRPLAVTKTRDQGALLATFFALSDLVHESETKTEETVIVMKTADLVLQCLQHPNSVADDLLIFIALAKKTQTMPQPVAAFDDFSAIDEQTENEMFMKTKKTMAKP